MTKHARFIADDDKEKARKEIDFRMLIRVKQEYKDL